MTIEREGGDIERRESRSSHTWAEGGRRKIKKIKVLIRLKKDFKKYTNWAKTGTNKEGRPFLVD